ncbi:MAG: hypothetical protein RLZZ210_776 [Pseudomonadota bacterium]
MNVNDIRKAFLEFFASKGHTIVPSSSLVPNNDPTLLFTNSGMVQFKDVFLGKEQKNYIRATSSQRSVRAGGKHNDLENVGYTARHHTFFEMLGNFSFGDYFKRDAIFYAWELLTTIYKLPQEKLWVTVYIEDDEAYNIWLNEIGVPAQRIIRIGDNKGSRYASDNFWQMADTGPCGPCSEIFYDHGEGIYGGPPGSPEEDGDRYIEIWNLVFMQFNRDESGVLTPLPKPCVDTGMGLERVSAVLQHVHSNYEIDLFANLIKDIALVIKDANQYSAQLNLKQGGQKNYDEDSTNSTARSNFADNAVLSSDELNNNSLKVIADHLRASCFLIIDGVLPSNEGRGYVLRRILRRGIRHGYKLGIRSAFIYKLVKSLAKQMGEAYNELNTMQTQIEKTIEQEEQRFFETLFNGMDILEKELEKLTKNQNPNGLNIFSGEVAFKLHDTYGFPLDLTADICRERNINVDEKEFDKHMQKQKEQARAAGKFKALEQLEYDGNETNFTGYTDNSNSAQILAIYIDGKEAEAEAVNAGQNAVIVLDNTPFYAESGGQVGDSGTIIDINNSQNIFIVEDTQKIQTNVNGHYGFIESGTLKVGQKINAKINQDQRISTQRNHSATHLMHKALHNVLGNHIQQKGSLVDAQKLRFDFSHNQGLSAQEISLIEQQVNQEILANNSTQAQVMGFDDAKQSGATALFGEKYGDSVRVLTIGNSKELCGGTHVERTGDIGLFKIVSEAGISAGIRRIEAVTGLNALNYLQTLETQASQIAQELKTSISNISTKTSQINDSLKSTQKQLQQTELELAILENSQLVNNAKDIGNSSHNAKILVANVTKGSHAIREIAEALKQKFVNAKVNSIIILATKDNDAGKANVLVSIDKNLHGIVKANEIAGSIAQKLGGKGGGKPDLAQGGGSDIANLQKALDEINNELISRLS